MLAGVSSLGTASTAPRRAPARRRSAAQHLLETTEAEIHDYYRAVCDAISLPVMVYNNPFTTGMDLPVPFLAKLAALPNVTMIGKQSRGKIARCARRARTRPLSTSA